MPAAGDQEVLDITATFEQSGLIAGGAAVYTQNSADEGEYEVTLTNVGGDAENDTIVFTYTGGAAGLTVDCTGGTLDNKFRPAACR
jgi:hypothetical protein